jgi:hypothetical protein
MKNLILTLVLTSLNVYVFSQSPQSFQYQAVIRDALGNALQSQSVSLKLSIIPISALGAAEYVETHTISTNAFGIVSLSVGTGNVVTGDFSLINWGATSHFIKVEADLGSGYIDMGTTQLLSVPYAMYSQTAGNVDTLWNKSGNNIYSSNPGNVGVGLNNPIGRMVVQGSSTALPTDPLFEVKNSIGQTVFVVYQDSVNVFVNDDAIQSNRGGFAVSGRNNTKALTHNYLKVTPDKTRIFLNEDIASDGFAVMGINSGGNKDFLNVSVDTTEIINPSQARVLWYPTKEALLTGRVLIEDRDSVGVNSFASGFISKAKGDWSQALGYKPIARGDYSTAIGKNAIANGLNSYAIGDSVIAFNSGSFSLGYKSQAIGEGSLAFGSVQVDEFGVQTGNLTKSEGAYSFAIGLGARTTTLGFASISMGIGSLSDNYGAASFGVLTKASGRLSSAIGYNSVSTGDFSLAIGISDTSSGKNSFSMGVLSKASGQSSMAIGNNSKASGIMSASIGFNTIASGDNSMALGRFISTNNNNGSIIIGDASTLVTTNSTNPNQFMVRAAGGYVFYSDPLLLEINSLFLSPLTGRLGVGWSNPQAKVDINGSLRVNSGTTFNKIQGGTATVGSNLIGGVFVSNVVFSTPFIGIPKVTVTAKGGNYNDVYVVTTRNVNGVGFQVNVFRVDNAGGSWSQNLEIDWIAWE